MPSPCWDTLGFLWWSWGDCTTLTALRKHRLSWRHKSKDKAKWIENLSMIPSNCPALCGAASEVFHQEQGLYLGLACGWKGPPGMLEPGLVWPPHFLEYEPFCENPPFPDVDKLFYCFTKKALESKPNLQDDFSDWPLAWEEMRWASQWSVQGHQQPVPSCRYSPAAGCTVPEPLQTPSSWVLTGLHS